MTSLKLTRYTWTCPTTPLVKVGKYQRNRPGLGRKRKYSVDIDLDNASQKVQLKELEVNNLPASIHAMAE